MALKIWFSLFLLYRLWKADYLPVSEDHPMKKAESPYGYQVCENIILIAFKNQIFYAHSQV